MLKSKRICFWPLSLCGILKWVANLYPIINVALIQMEASDWLITKMPRDRLELKWTGWNYMGLICHIIRYIKTSGEVVLLAGFTSKMVKVYYSSTLKIYPACDTLSVTLFTLLEITKFKMPFGLDLQELQKFSILESKGGQQWKIDFTEVNAPNFF